ncbi:MAG: hypothetical protein ABL958_06110 [Bdellovibrionia bacterium]
MKRSLFLAIPLIVGLLIFSCSKEKETKDERQVRAYISKADLPQTASMVRGIDEASSNNPFYAVPGFHFDFGIVKTVITENSLEFHAVAEADGHPDTATIVASYPIESHFDIVKQKNDYGEETNILIEDQKRPWADRGFMRVDWAHPKASQGSVVNQLWSIGNLAEEDVVILKDPAKNANGVFSFSTDSLIKESGAADYYNDYGEGIGGSYRVKTSTYLVPYTKSDFKPRDYTNKEFERYGYFRTFENFLDPERGPLDTTVKRFMNIFNVCGPNGQGACATNKVTYRLTENFYNGGAASGYLALTKQAISQWNNVFKAALGRKDDVIVLDETPVAISDPTSSAIAFYDRNTEAGLLGVSQTRVDSTTGETMNARSTVYGDGIRYSIARVEDYVKELRDTTGIPGCTAPVPTAQDIAPTHVLGHSVPVKNMSKPIGTSGSLPKDMTKIAKFYVEKSKGNVAQAFQRRKQLFEKEPGLLTPSDLTTLMTAKGKPGETINEIYQDALVNKQSDARKKLKKIDLKMAALGIHGAELVDEATKHYVAKFALTHKSLCGKPTEFIAELKKEVANLTYYTTLLHEMGHNFGLRHNFHGSSDDEALYHPQYQVIKKSLASGSKQYSPLDLDFYSYTSVMDYSSAFYEVQGGLGPYDGAAVRFGYNRNLPSSDPSVKTPFKFCTDHYVGEDTLCTRFDKGTNLSTATLNNIERFNRGYLRSHFRRGRVNFEDTIGSVIMSSFFYTMIPTRQVMDEFIYQIITSPGAQQNNLGCGSEFYRASIAAGEFANICDPAIAEDNWVNMLDWDTLANGLFTKASLDAGKPVFRKDPKTFIPNGLADLVLANALARNFFAGIIGSPNPGLYLVEPFDLQKNTKKLTMMPPGASDEDSLRNYAIELAQAGVITNVDLYVTQQKPNLVRLNLGPITAASPANNLYVSPIATNFTSQSTITGGYEELQNIGFIWQKYLAMIALGSRYVGVSKYERMSMMGNAYLWPQGRKWTTDLIDGMATDREYIGQSYVTTMGGTTHLAYVPATSDINLRAIAIMIGVADLSTDSDSSFVDKLRMCDSQDASKCTPTLGQDVIQFDSASGTNFFKASQTLEKDSIGFQIVKDGKIIADQRKQHMLDVANSPQILAGAKTKLTGAETKRKTLDNLLKSENGLKDLSDKITSTTATQSVWVQSKFLLDNLGQFGVFKTIDFANWSVGLFVEALQRNQSTPDATKRAQIEAAIYDLVPAFIRIAQGAPTGALDDAITIKAAPEMVRISTQDLGVKETIITITRRFMKWLSLD